MSSQPTPPKTSQDPKSRARDDFSIETPRSQTPSPINTAITSPQPNDPLSPKALLTRYLSLSATIPPQPPPTPKPHTNNPRSQYRQIGSGTCASVYQVCGHPSVLKAAKHPGQETDSLWNDYMQHILIQDIFDRFGRQNWAVRVPRCFWFIGQEDSTWWGENFSRFPGLQDRWTNVLCSEHIRPVPRLLRHALIEEYCPKSGINQAKELDANKDCLVRVYLGKRRTRSNLKFFSLRNFNLNLDQMEDLQLDIKSFVIAIAEAMAVMHWICWLDANDVEFVLGSSPNGTADPRLIIPKPLSASDLKKMAPNTSTLSAHLLDFTPRHIHIWMLDFNRCNQFQAEDLEPLVHSFFRNDPYFPRPCALDSKDGPLWALFRNTYVERGIEGLKSTGNDKYAELPGKAMEMIEKEQGRRNKA